MFKSVQQKQLGKESVYRWLKTSETAHLLVTTILCRIVGRHHCDKVDQSLHLIVVEVGQKLGVLRFELLENVLVLEQFFDSAIALA